MKTLLTVALVLLLALPALAQDPQKPMTPEQQKMMEAWMKAATPGPEHKALDGMIGTWNTKVSYWPAPGAPPEVSEGTSENRWILGGRFVEQRFTGTMMGGPFEGLGYTGYDNVKKKYWGTWMDTSATGYMVSSGTATAGGKVWNFDGTFSDAMTGKDVKVKEKIYMKSPDEHVFEMWGPTPGGKKGSLFKMMEIVYTRKR